MQLRRLWIGFALVILLSFSVLGWVGGRIYHMAPVPART
jgi:nitric oxide reductase large subunit